MQINLMYGNLNFIDVTLKKGTHGKSIRVLRNDIYLFRINTDFCRLKRDTLYELSGDKDYRIIDIRGEV